MTIVTHSGGIVAEYAAPLSWSSPIEVVVVAHQQAGVLCECLDALGAQRIQSRFDITVVDCMSDDRTADVALRHPAVSRVLLCTETFPRAALQLGGHHARRPIVAFTDATSVVDESWLTTGVAALTGGVDVAVLERTPMADMFVNRAVIDRIGFGVREGTDAYCALARSAGFVVRAVQEGDCVGRVVTPAVQEEGGDGRVVARAARCASPTGDRLAPAHDDTPLASIVVCTHGRVPALERCLRSLTELDDDHYEILVIDNDDAPAVDPAALPAGVRHIHEPQRGLDVARNRGMREAHGAIVAFIDDDCTADPGWLRGIRAAFDDDCVGMVTGRVVPASLARPSERWFEAWFSFDRGQVRTRFTWHDRLEWFPLWTGTIGTGCNMAFRRDEFLKSARFDPALDMGTPIGGGGDLDIFAQYLDGGTAIAYAPDALVRHYHRDNARALRRQFFGYGTAIGAVCMKHALGRPRVRRAAVRYYFHQLRLLRRKLANCRDGLDTFPPSLLAMQAAGQALAPVLYIWSRARARSFDR